MKFHSTLTGFDPRAVGFRCGLEVHQQLLTDHKLFCSCPAGDYSDEYHAHVVRHMRPTLSELGEYDGTALMEFKTHKEIVYKINKHSVCTYEMDDNPPFAINRQAVDIAIEAALLFNCSIVDELHVIRKQYLDGSIPAGFQRTAIVGWQGWMPLGDRKIGIRQVAVEEDSCREVSDLGHRRVYMTDRLSIPLIEVVTEPDILTPEEAYEVGMQIGRITRATGKVRRGIGRVRQDVNVSITGGTRIEIKGVPRIPLFPALVYYEAYRQHRLLVLRDILSARNITAENLTVETFDMTEELQELPPQQTPGVKIGVIVLRGMKGLLAHPIGPHRTFADDISGRIRVIACLQERKPLRHTDEGAEGCVPDSYRQLIAERTGMTSDDTAAIVRGSSEDVDTALREVAIRCREATTGIPCETRQRLDTGETDFERILPGPDRMYPDTDSPPTAIRDEAVAAIRDRLPVLPWVRKERYAGLGLSGIVLARISESPHAPLFDKLLEAGVSPALAAAVLLDLTTHFIRLGGSKVELNDDLLLALFNDFAGGNFAKEGFRLIFERAALEGCSNMGGIVRTINPEPVGNDEIAARITDAAGTASLRTDLPRPARLRLAMGAVMETLRGRVDGTTLFREVEKLVP